MSIRKSAQVALLVLILLLGWALFSIIRLIKGEEWSRGKQAEFEKNNILGVTPARADAPGGGDPGGSASTPFLAAWNGNEYKIENDFLFGKPRSYFSDFGDGKRSYEAGWVSPDLYKIQSAFQPREGKLTFQIQEIEPEESFINGMTLLRVTHPAKSEVVVNSDYGKFYVLDKKKFLGNFIGPASVKSKNGEDVSYLADNNNLHNVPAIELTLSENDYVDAIFAGIASGGKYFLVTKSHYRDWVMGENPSLLSRAQFWARSFAGSRMLSKAIVASSLLFAPWLHKNGLLVPFIMLGGGGSAGSSAGSTSCCLPISFKNSSGQYRQFTTIEPRGWRSSVEMTEIPQEAISGSGDLHLRVSATKRHRLDFVGLARNPEELPYQMEALGINRAWHNRLREDVAALLQYRAGNYLHTIPGDTVDVEFERPKSGTPRGTKETYLLRSAGFYIYLSPESKKIAGNWDEKLSDEAKERLSFIKERNAGV